jgi:protein-disulfide isomerase
MLTVTLTLAAALMAVAIVKREFIGSGNSPSRPEGRAQFDANWRSATTHAITIGDSAAPVQIVEFVDFECPVCRIVHRGQLRDLRAQFGDSLAVRYVHFPLDQHCFARISAQAVECAAERGRVSEMIDLLFQRQDSFGLKSWESFGRDAGVTDTAGFDRCVRASPHVARIDSGYAVAKRRNVGGTPALIVNGWVLPHVPPTGELTRIVDAILAGRDPTK